MLHMLACVGVMFVHVCVCACAGVWDIEAESQWLCVRLHLQRQNWSQFTGLVTFGAFRVFAAGGPNWQNDCDKRTVFAAAVK